MPSLSTQHSALSSFLSWWGRLWPAPQGAAVTEHILAALPDMILHIGADGILRHIRPPKENPTTLDPLRHTGKHITDVGLTDSLAHMVWQNTLRAINTGEIVQAEYDVLVGDALRRRELRCVAINGEEAVLIVRDITAEAQARTNLHQQSQAQNLLVQISSMLLDAPPAEFGVRMAETLLAVGKLYHLDCVSVLEVQELEETMAVTYLWSADPERTQAFVSNTFALAKMPNLLAQLQVAPPSAIHWQMPDEERQAKLPHLQHIPCQSALILPILYRKILVGMLFLGRWRTPLIWREEAIQQMHLLADILIAAIARTKTEQTLREYTNELENHVALRTAELRQTNTELQRALRAKDEFLSTMSHELRTPLHAVIGLSQALQEQVRGTLNERQLHTVSIIEQSGYRLLNLINNILDLAKLETETLPLRYQTFGLHQLGEGCVAGVRRQAEKKQLTMTYTIATPQAQMTTDFQRAQQTLTHLLTNAIKFTEEGGRVTLTADLNEATQEVIWTVSDTGIGIAPADLERIFQPFVQLDSSLARQHEGTGLGLGLAAKLAHVLGGRLTASSTPGQGSTFTLILPLAPLTTASVNPPPLPAPPRP